MKVDATPWARARLSAEQTGTLRVVLPDSYYLSLWAPRPSGPYHARLSMSQRGLALAIHHASPYDAAMRAIAKAAGTSDDGALARQLAASLRAIGIEPAVAEGAA